MGIMEKVLSTISICLVIKSNWNKAEAIFKESNLARLRAASAVASTSRISSIVTASAFFLDEQATTKINAKIAEKNFNNFIIKDNLVIFLFYFLCFSEKLHLRF